MSNSYIKESNTSQRKHTNNQNQDTISNPTDLEKPKDEIRFDPTTTNSKDEEILKEIIVDSLIESNDLTTVLSSQISPEEIVTNSDIANTDNIIEQSRQLEEKSNQEQTRQIMWANLIDILKKSSINIILPFINGMMLGFGEILAHEIGFRYNWIGAKVEPVRRLQQRKIALENQQLQSQQSQQSQLNRINGARFL
ncbi:uncharacterized protein KGF55_003736 [Candida pseudojiufengensis]|uniref:uncharacterized protein n=1 Tax=Candida pseudojiufengensis TaxID=497109 RepID=UPI00222574A2|nr:uncharacterized protein KGF55_003736 [Candida pseudojiufengensis]KAI5962660.1 hypothetical protein KGF55_003736 [Candida pseudojiufengensis]